MKTSKAKIAPPVNRLRTKFLFALLLSTFFTVSLFAQSPAAFNFQAVARNAGGVAINNTTVGVQFQLHQTSTYGTVVYAETHAPITNEFGLFTVQVGNGTPSIGTLSAVNWNAGPYFLEISIDPAGGTSYTSMGSGQLFSVPYALASGSSGFWGTNGIDINNTNSGRIGIGTSTPGTVANTNAKIEIADENGLNSGILMRTAGGGVPVITLAKQEGILANPSAVDPDAEVGALEATYYNGLAYGVSSSIRMSAGYSDGTDHPGVIEVQTTPAGSSAPMTRILINETGNVGIGTETPARILDVNGDALIHGLTIGKGNGEEPTNSVIGIDALISNTSGTNNTAVGASALLANTAGYSNTATGVNALNSNTEGGRNTATGVSALYYNSTGFNNTAVGLKALWSNSTASWNTAIGIESALSKAGPDIITVVGARALSNATNGPNTALGYNAGHETTTGTHNVAAGGNALVNNTEGSYNTAVGVVALSSNTTGSGNTAIGYLANVSSGALVNATAIGQRASVGVSNALVLGGTGVHDVNVGIGTSTPEVSAALELKSNTQGFLPPRMTGAERNAILSPEAGLIIWCKDCGNNAGEMQMYFGSAWKTVEGGGTVPSVLTVDVAVGSLTGTRARINANITSDGGAFVYASGICWSTSPEPSIALSTKTIDGPCIGTYTSPITGLDSFSTYYVRAYATNLNGTFYGNELSFTTTDHMIGDLFQGGLLIYRLQPGDPGYDASVPHGLIVAPMDQSANAPWGCYGTSTAALDSTLGTGGSNTAAILSTGCSNASDAVRLCADLDVNGYNDWYLPSKEELNKLYLNRVAIFGIPLAFKHYWSSTQLPSSTDAWKHNFPDDYQYAEPTNLGSAVRAFRSF